VVAASSSLAAEAVALGAADVVVIPHGVSIPDAVEEPSDPPHVLYVGRLSAEKGILEFLDATEGMPRVIVGDGPLRSLVPEATGFVPRHELSAYYERAGVVACPSRREGYGVAAREAMACGRPVVASAVGGLLDAVDDGVTGLLVPPGDVPALRGALARLLGDSELRGRLGAAARHYVESELSWDVLVDRLLALYADVASVLPQRGRMCA
jgi:glycosyltransferase involved in cell wall biosynthesis